jgi:cyanophycin synthetase
VAKVLELNARPEWLHHTFSERRTHDVAALILESLFGKLA